MNSKPFVASTRIRLARNLEGYQFPSHLKDEKQAKEIIRLVAATLSRLEEFSLYHMDSISKEKALALKENHLISANLIANKRISAVLINRDESVSVMINEEDHLREQCIVKGLDLRGAYDKMSKIDSCISRAMKFAYDDEFGFLTACPTNIGTGLRASVMMFLPALTINGVMPDVIREISTLGFTVRGIYGEGSEAEGYMYQISNEVTLGVTEKQVLSQVEKAVEKLCKVEGEARQILADGPNSLELCDECMRSYGILTNCAKLTTDELIRLSAYVKLGACLGILNLDDISLIDDLAVKMRPSNINSAAERELSPLDRDIYRAQYTGKYLKKIFEK